VEGLHSILTSMSRRTRFESGMENAAAELELNYDLYKKEFREFFPELISFSQSELLRLHGNR
jgi:acyl carrier protein phosphodiesterase